MTEAGIEPSTESVGDSNDTAPAETINELLKAELNHRRLFDFLENISLAEVEAILHAALKSEAMVAKLTQTASGKPGAFQGIGNICWFLKHTTHAPRAHSFILLRSRNILLNGF